MAVPANDTAHPQMLTKNADRPWRQGYAACDEREVYTGRGPDAWLEGCHLSWKATPRAFTPPAWLLTRQNTLSRSNNAHPGPAQQPPRRFSRARMACQRRQSQDQTRLQTRRFRILGPCGLTKPIPCERSSTRMESLSVSSAYESELTSPPARPAC